VSRSRKSGDLIGVWTYFSRAPWLCIFGRRGRRIATKITSIVKARGKSIFNVTDASLKIWAAEAQDLCLIQLVVLVSRHWQLGAVVPFRWQRHLT
jgi:hypothetical protein